MEKPYDFKALGQMVIAEAKVEGLTIAEEALEKLGKAVYFGSKKWFKESALLSGTKIDDFVAPFIDNLDPIVMKNIDKLDLDNDGK